ncbi:hypothetical protein JKG47_02850 [Acidithiobacillus sp. MC6.1]|nr:hypothetical protein [Acidithiobacillus sp. MC6.1]
MGKKKIAVLMVAALVSGHGYAATQPNLSVFKDPGLTPSRDLIAWPLVEDTPSNTVIAASRTPAPVSPPAPSSLSGFPRPNGAAVGLLMAIKNPNMSQSVADCTPPPVPQPSCSCGGYAGTVTWSGWDQVTGGTCAAGGAGGWLTTQGGCYACPPPAPTVTNTIYTGYGGFYTLYSNGTTIRTNTNGFISAVINGHVTLQDGKVNTVTINNGVMEVQYVASAGGPTLYGKNIYNTNNLTLFNGGTIANVSAAGFNGLGNFTSTSSSVASGGAVSVGSGSPGL